MKEKRNVGRPKKNPDLETRKVLVEMPVPVLDMMKSLGVNRTEFVNEAVLEKLVKMRRT